MQYFHVLYIYCEYDYTQAEFPLSFDNRDF